MESHKYGYCQYIFFDQNEGPLIQVFRQIDEGNSSSAEVVGSGNLFAPVITGVKAAVSRGVWEVIGHCKIEEFKYPIFRATNGDPFDFNSTWFLYDGCSEATISPLPEYAWCYE